MQIILMLKILNYLRSVWICLVHIFYLLVFENHLGLKNLLLNLKIVFQLISIFKQELVNPKNHVDTMAHSDASAWKGAEIEEIQGLIDG